MINNENLKNRDIYLNKLIAFQDKELVKIISGLRRTGKSKLLLLMANHLLAEGKEPSQIIEMNFEKMEFFKMNYNQIYEYVKKRIIKGKKMYLFFDEIQRVYGWENAINALRVEFDTDIYITGSNAYLLSSEYSTYLAGRYVEIKMYPLSFKEFLYFYDFKTKIETGYLGIKKIVISDKKGLIYSVNEVFDAYLRFGGMPGISDIGLDYEKAFMLLDGIYNTVVIRDILERDKIRNQSTITNAILLKKIILFLADNIGSTISFSKIGNRLESNGLLNESSKNIPSSHTIEKYVNSLLETYLFYEIKRFDIKGREYLKTFGKYYIADIGIRNYLLGVRNRDRGHILENIVYFELLRRGYDVSIGKIDDKEIDFIASKLDERIYIQVTESLYNEQTRLRELESLKKIKDNYPKIILSMDDGEKTYDGINVVNIINWLLDY